MKIHLQYIEISKLTMMIHLWSSTLLKNHLLTKRDIRKMRNGLLFNGMNHKNFLLLSKRINAEILKKCMKENEALRKKLEESQKLITILQQKANIDPFNFMDHLSGNDIFAENNEQILNTDVFFGLDE